MTTFTYFSYSSYSSSIAAANGVSSTIILTPTGGTSIHDAVLIITPLQGGEFALFVTAQGLEPGGTYLIEGFVGGAHTNVGPIALNTSDSSFTADNQGNGVYSHVLATDPRTTYTIVLLLYLPNNQMEGAVLVATGST